MNEFFNPKSMSTPGIAGALMMLLANTVCSIFPEIAFRYVALALSFTIGTTVFSAASMKIWERGIYWIVNSLVIFSMGVGGSNIAANVSAQQASEGHSMSETASRVGMLLLSSFSSTAYAQSDKVSRPMESEKRRQDAIASSAAQPTNGAKIEALKAQIEALETQLRQSRLVNQRAQMAVPSALESSAMKSGDAKVKEERDFKAEKLEAMQKEGFFKRW